MRDPLTGPYARRFFGEALALEARIIFVADAFEAMTSDRPYRRGMDVGDALTVLALRDEAA